MKCYHITLKENLQSIFQNGLLPSIGENSLSCDENKECIYCFPDIDTMENALTNWLSELFEPEQQLVLLEINTNVPYVHENYELIFILPIPYKDIVNYIEL